MHSLFPIVDHHHHHHSCLVEYSDPNERTRLCVEQVNGPPLNDCLCQRWTLSGKAFEHRCWTHQLDRRPLTELGGDRLDLSQIELGHEQLHCFACCQQRPDTLLGGRTDVLRRQL